jgi:hypothetical protein
MRVYVASSWRNEKQPRVVEALRRAGYDVYDFRQPVTGNEGFHWSTIDPDWKQWNPEQFRQALHHPIAKEGFQFNKNALDNCDACVLVLPCGRSAHLEAGYAIGQGKPTAILLETGEPELMYKLSGNLYLTISGITDFLKTLEGAN